MPKAIVEKPICEKCGVDVRENTTFCYNCGSRITAFETDRETAMNGSTAGISAETKSALDDLAVRLRLDDSAENDKLAKAAAERKKARVSQRKSNEFVWEPADDSSGRLIILLAVLVSVVVAGIVFVTVFWR